jgi:hypothetical protein
MIVPEHWGFIFKPSKIQPQPIPYLSLEQDCKAFLRQRILVRILVHRTIILIKHLASIEHKRNNAHVMDCSWSMRLSILLHKSTWT